MFVPPDAESRRLARAIPDAIAARLNFNTTLARGLRETTTMLPSREALPGEWLHEHPDERAGQTVKQFVRRAQGNGSLGIGCYRTGGAMATATEEAEEEKRGQRRPPRRRKIVLVPIEFGERPPYKKYVVNGQVMRRKELESMREFLQIWLQFPEDGVVLAPKMTKESLEEAGGNRTRIASRTDTNDEGETYMQFDLVGILENLDALYESTYEDAYAVVGLTPSLLYYSKWRGTKFLEGLASMNGRHACFSFFTMPNSPAQLRRGSLSVMAHEVSHTLGVAHCVHYDTCYMRGSETQEESLTVPLVCCPVEMNKLQLVSGPFDPMRRFRQLLRFYTRHRMPRERDVMKCRILELESSGSDDVDADDDHDAATAPPKAKRAKTF